MIVPNFLYSNSYYFFNIIIILIFLLLTYFSLGGKATAPSFSKFRSQIWSTHFFIEVTL